MIALLTKVLEEEQEEEERLSETQLVWHRSVSLERMLDSKPRFDEMGKPVMRYQTVTVTQGNTGPGHLFSPH